MNEQGTLQASLSRAGARGEYPRSRPIPAPLIGAEGSLLSSSERIGILVKCAMAYFESNHATALRCLNDASILLDAELDGGGTPASLWEPSLQPGGLAAWQAKRTLEYIEANLGSKIAIYPMASLVGLSRSHFSRAFKRTLGCSPMMYVAGRRVERAKLMMISTRERITDIAFVCGFSDQSHLNRCFRRLVGVSPGFWRRTLTPPPLEPRGIV